MFFFTWIMCVLSGVNVKVEVTETWGVFLWGASTTVTSPYFGEFWSKLLETLGSVKWVPRTGRLDKTAVLTKKFRTVLFKKMARVETAAILRGWSCVSYLWQWQRQWSSSLKEAFLWSLGNWTKLAWPTWLHPNPIMNLPFYELVQDNSRDVQALMANATKRYYFSALQPNLAFPVALSRRIPGVYLYPFLWQDKTCCVW